jgi:hypothetical protein
MDSRAVNIHCKNHLGFFLTTSAEAHAERDVIDEAVAFVSKRLRDEKIRSSNFLERLKDIEALAEHAANMIAVSSKARDISEDGSKALAYAIIYATMSSYHLKIKKMLAKKDE